MYECTERDDCEECGLEFDESELNSNGVCDDCERDLQEEADVLDEEDDDDREP